MKIKQLSTCIALALSIGMVSATHAHEHGHKHDTENYGPYPVTVKGYTGDKTNSVAYTGQMARHALQNSLKKLVGKSDGTSDKAYIEKLMSYYASKDAGRAIIDPASKGDFKVKQTTIDEISKKKNLKGKTYKGAINGFPGNMTGAELTEFWINKAAAKKGGYDALTGYDYTQLISKFLMGAVFYNQAVDNYLDEKLEADNKPNNKPYKDGAYYTGKEHAWDEAFGYFGAPAHAMSLGAKDAYGIAKKKDLSIADANKDGVVDLITEMTYGHAYYAADADKSGKTDYLHNITEAFIDGRKLIASAKGEALTDSQRTELKGYADTIKKNWEQVIAEAAFKYAGSVYKDIKAMQADTEGANAQTNFRKYAKHWGELKGFALALQTSGKDLGETAVKLNRLIGYSPALLGSGQVVGIKADGSYDTSGKMTMNEYMGNMIKTQQLLANKFDLKAKKNDVSGEMANLIKSIGDSKSIEND